jgi:hypothetical protein
MSAKIIFNKNNEQELKTVFEVLAIRRGVQSTIAELGEVAEQNADAWEAELRKEVDIIEEWHVGLVVPEINKRVRYNDIIYRAVQPHIVTDPNWTPPNTLSLYRLAPVIEAGKLFPTWSSIGLLDSVNFWGMNAIVWHNGQYWKSGHATNVWEPGVSQWTVFNP